MPQQAATLKRRRHLPIHLGKRTTLQVRADGEGEEQRQRIAGYGAVFYREGDPGSEYWLWDDFVERFMPGSFDRALAEDDVRSAFNHDLNLLLGRTSAGTLTLSVDDTGLAYDVAPPAARADVLEAVSRGDVTGSSIMFIPTAITWREETIGGKRIDIREINEVQLWEVGPVAFPAYESTTSELRVAADEARPDQDEREAHRRSISSAARRRFAINARMRMLALGDPR